MKKHIDEDFNEEEIMSITDKIKQFMIKYKHGDDILSPFSVHEVEEHEQIIGYSLPISFKNYITKVSREFWHNSYRFRVIFDLNDIKSNTNKLYLNGCSCSNHNYLILRKKSFGKIQHQIANNNYSQYPRIVFCNFKEFVMETLEINKKN
jgi:hypothetical protein